MLHKLYTDYKNANLTNPCSVKFKTDKLHEVITLHQIKFDDDYGSKEDVAVHWLCLRTVFNCKE